MAPKERDWFGCYGESWGQEIRPEAYSHPAKFSRNLIRRIYEHTLERGYLREGDVVLDPFGGVALGAADALANGLNFVGVELEQFFVDLGAGCDCTGISKADWVRSINRRKRFAYRDGRHWCPQCLAEAERVIKPRPPTLPGFEQPTASYQRSSGKIAHTEPHHYTGNLELFARHARDGATAVLLRGDSRDLARVLDGARAEGIVASPPWSSVQIYDDKSFIAIDSRPKYRGTRWERRRVSEETASAQDGYGTDPANLGNMPAGEPPQAVIASPPWSQAQYTDRRGDEHPYQMNKVGTQPGRHPTPYCHPDSDGQLAALPEGEPPTYTYTPGSLTRTPFDARAVADSITFTKVDKPKTIEMKASEGEPPAQAIVSSPPWENQIPQQDHQWIADKKHNLRTNPRRPGERLDFVEYAKQDSNGNIGNQQGDTFWGAARAILLQCHQVLAPGGHAIWVVKDFVRNKKRVDFTGQWRSLCESCGFETVEVIRAWLVEDRGAQFALDGELVEREVRRESFFRRLHRQKYPHLSIDYEVVLVTRKAARGALGEEETNEC